MRILWLAALAAMGCAANVPRVAAPDVRVDDDGFTKRLETWGVWSEDATYGAVWTPADARFVPYATDGYFADVGGEMTWLSDLPWGETLHRGWWVRARGRWRWVPGSRRSGAVVRWIRDGERTAWAPAAPPWIARDAPIVGSLRDDELAVTVLGAPESVDDATDDEEQLRDYAAIGREIEAAGREAAR